MGIIFMAINEKRNKVIVMIIYGVSIGIIIFAVSYLLKLGHSFIWGY